MALIAISNKLSSGNFEDAVKDAEVFFKVGDQFRHAVYIIRKVCGGVVKIPSLSQAQTQSIKRICCLCLSVMIRDKVGDIIEVDQVLTASLFHIAKALGKDDPEAFAELICASLPVLESMPTTKDTKQYLTLTNFCSLVANNLSKLLDILSKSNDADIESQLQKYLKMVLQVFNLSKKDFSIGFSNAEKIIVFYCGKVKSAKEIEEFASKILLSLNQSSLGSAVDAQDPDFNKFYFKCLKAVLMTFKSICAMNEYELAFKIWKEMTNTLKAVLPTSSIQSKALCIIDKSLNPFLFSVNTVPSSKMPFTDLQEAFVLLKKATAENTEGSKALEQAAWAISSVLFSLMFHWIKNMQKVKSFFPLLSLSNLDELFTELVVILKSGSCFLCIHKSKQCMSKGDINYAFQLELVLLFLCAWIINWDADSRTLLLKVCENSFGRCEELLLKIAEKSCLESVDFYGYLCERVCAIAVRNADSPDICVKLAERGKDWCIQYIKAKGSPIPFVSTARKIMRILAVNRRDLNQASSACEAVAVELLLNCQSSEQSEDSILSKLWSEVVSAFPNEYVPLLALLKTNKVVRDFFGDNNKRAYDPTGIFIWEAKALGSRNPQEFSVLLKHWKTRKELNLSPLQKIKSAAYFLRALGVCGELEKVQKFIATFKTKEYHELLKFIPSADCPVALCELAQLVYCRFFIDIKIHQTSSKERVEEAKTVRSLEKVVLSTEDVVHQNDVCDLTPTFVDISVSKEASLLSNLDTALRYWDESLKKGLEASLLSTQELRLFADYLTNTALHYRLSGHYLKEKHAWEVCRSFGLQVCNDQLVLHAVSGLMELGCCDAGWVQRAKMIEATLADDPTAKNVLHIYKNSYIVYCFSHDMVEEGAALLKEVLKSEVERSWLYTKSRFLLARILLETSGQLRTLLFSDEYDDVFTIARKCYLDMLYLIKRVETKGGIMCWSNVIEHSYVADLLFAISIWLGYTYLKMMLPREARCYLKQHLLVVQKRGLSARTAECLSLLGKVDILVQKIEDGVVKVEGLKQILEIESASKEDVGDEIPVYRDEEDMDRLRAAPKLGNQTGASPDLPVARYAMPEFVSHKETCGCYYCSHILIHSMWLDASLIQAEAFSSQCQVRPARNFFRDAMKFADACHSKHEKLLNGFSDRALMLEDFIRSKTMLRLKFADLLIVEGKDSERTVKQAWEINESLSAFLDKTQSKDVLLRTDVGEQRISLIDIRNLQASTQDSKQLVQVSSTTAVTPTMLNPKNISALKTPLTSLPGERPRTPLEPIALQNVVPIKGKAFIKGRGVLPLAFHLSDSDEEVVEEKYAKTVRDLEVKAKGKEDGRKEREKKPKPGGKSTKRGETKTNLKGGSSASLSAVTVNIKKDSDRDAILISGSEDEIIQPTDSDDDLKVLSRLVSPAINVKNSRTSKKVCEALSKLKIDDSNDEVSSRKVKAARNKVETSGAEAEKAKSRRTASASEKTGQTSCIPVRTTRSRRFL